MSASPGDVRDRACALCALDPLRHIVGLKMLERAGATADVRLREDAAGWAALIGFDASAFEYDARTYGSGARILVLEGTSDVLLLELLAGVDALSERELIVKTASPAVVRRALERAGARPAATFVSFTAVSGGAPRDAGVARDGLIAGSELSPEVAALFERNGYGSAELARYFADGARWFALERNGALAAACFVFQNFGRVWEVAGVHTEASWRRQGLAARVVQAALAHLLSLGTLPRYQTSGENAASLALARRIGLIEFLRIEHVRIERVRA